MSVSNLKKYPLKQITTITESARNFDICSKKSYTKERRRDAIIELWVTNVKRGAMLLSKLWQSRWNVENLWSNTLYYTIQGHHLLCNIWGGGSWTPLQLNRGISVVNFVKAWAPWAQRNGAPVRLPIHIFEAYIYMQNASCD